MSEDIKSPQIEKETVVSVQKAASQEQNRADVKSIKVDRLDTDNVDIPSPEQHPKTTTISPEKGEYGLLDASMAVAK